MDTKMSNITHTCFALGQNCSSNSGGIKVPKDPRIVLLGLKLGAMIKQ